MKQYEIFDGRTYLLTVVPSEDPWAVLEEERKRRRNPRLSMIEVENRVRTLAEGPSMPEPVDLDEIDFSGEEEEEDA